MDSVYIAVEDVGGTWVLLHIKQYITLHKIKEYRKVNNINNYNTESKKALYFFILKGGENIECILCKS